MSLNNLNTYPAAGSVTDTDKVIINGQEYTADLLQAYIGGDESTFDGSESIMKADKNTGRGKLVTLAQLKAFVNGSSSPVTTNDIFPVISSGSYKKATGTVMQSYLDTFDINTPDGLKVWYDATDNAALSLSGSNVTQVHDKSGSNNHSSPTSVTITTDSLTGKQVLNVDDSTSGLPLTTELSNSSFTLFLVHKLLIHSGSTVYFGGANGHANYLTTLAENSLIGIGGGGTQTYQFDESSDQMAVMCIRQNSGVQQTIEYNGRQRIRTTGSVPSVPFYVGRLGSYNSGLWAGGTLAGFAYYDNFLSDDDARKVARKLSQTHNINPGPFYKIVGFGDSYTVGVGADAGNGWLYQVANSLGKSVAVQGISGSLFQDISGSDPNAGYNRYNRNLIEYPANDRLYILYGFNDIANGSATVERYETQLNAMAANIVAAGYDPDKVYIGTVPRWYGDDHSALVLSYGDAVRRVCTTYGFHCVEVYDALAANGGDSLFYADHIHPNNDGHTVIANAFLAA